MYMYNGSSVLLEYMTLNERGGELFKRGFLKTFSGLTKFFVWIQNRNQVSQEFKQLYSKTTEKQSVVSSKQLVVYISKA